MSTAMTLTGKTTRISIDMYDVEILQAALTIVEEHYLATGQTDRGKRLGRIEHMRGVFDLLLGWEDNGRVQINILGGEE